MVPDGGGLPRSQLPSGARVAGGWSSAFWLECVWRQGGAALILLGWGIAEALRSSLPVPLVSGSWSNFNLFPLIFIILSVVARVQRPPRLPAGGIVGCAVGGSVIVSILLFLYAIADGTLDRIVRAGAIVPEYIGLVAVGWVCLVLALLSHLALRVYRPAAPPQAAQGAEPRQDPVAGRAPGQVEEVDGHGPVPAV